MNRFREDLFHRLNVFTIALPALRDRIGDIPILASHFLKGFNASQDKSVRLAADAVEAMKRYSWPGNVRELRNVIERAITFNDTGVIQASELDLGEGLTKEPQAAESAGHTPPAGPAPPAAGGSLEDLEREHIIRVLRETRGNKKKAAEVLGIERRTLYNKAKRLGIDLSNA